MDEVAELGDLYAVLGCTSEATEKEIQKAYRKQSLTCHPDRNKDDPKAAEKFEQLTRAKEFLIDPSKRALYDEKQKAAEERARRFRELDEKSRNLRKDLERREEQARVALEEAKAKQIPKASTDIKADFERQVRERNERKQVRQAEIGRKMRKEIAKHARITLILRCDAVTRATLCGKIQKLLAPYKLIKVEIEEYSAELLFERRENALEALLYLRKEKKNLQFFAKARLEDDVQETAEETLDELERLAAAQTNVPKRTPGCIFGEGEEPLKRSKIATPKSPPCRNEASNDGDRPRDTAKGSSADDLLAELDAMMS